MKQNELLKNEKLNTARDNGFITPEERNIVFNDIFMMGKIKLIQNYE